jgi:hypothetical protein
MSQRILYWLVTTVLLTPAASAEAQQLKKIARIGYLSSGNPTSESPRSQAIRLALRELGYIEGKTSQSSSVMDTAPY